jgi:hypothetical protein
LTEGSAEGVNEKPSVPKSLEGLRGSTYELYQLFSSFLRGASRPKSPRVAAYTALLFMLEVGVVVKGNVSGYLARQQFVTLVRQILKRITLAVEPGRMAS